MIDNISCEIFIEGINIEDLKETHQNINKDKK